MCHEPERPLDADGTALLLQLERHLASDILEDSVPAHEDGWFNALEVRALLRKYPTTAMAFAFPKPIELPPSGFRTRSDLCWKSVEHACPPTFYVEVASVTMVRNGRQTALVLDYSAGPAGPPPKGAIWAWGILGQFCAVRSPTGTWRGFPMGPVAVS